MLLPPSPPKDMFSPEQSLLFQFKSEKEHVKQERGVGLRRELFQEKKIVSFVLYPRFIFTHCLYTKRFRSDIYCMIKQEGILGVQICPF